MELIQLTFELARGRKFSGEQLSRTIECFRNIECLGNIGLIVAPWKSVVFFLISIFALEASLLRQIFVLEHQISAG